MTRFARTTVLVCCSVALAIVFPSVASTHTYSYHAGGGADTVLGHEHTDELNGGAGCDTVAGRASWDYLKGGYSGCDVVRGQDGDDDVLTYTDDLGGDAAYGGAGYDICYVDGGDLPQLSCDEVVKVL